MSDRRFRGVVRDYNRDRGWSIVEEVEDIRDGTSPPFREVRINNDTTGQDGDQVVMGDDDQIVFGIRPITGDDGRAAADLTPSTSEDIGIVRNPFYEGIAPKRNHLVAGQHPMAAG